MSVIAHWIEQQGINTVVIGQVRLHLEKIKPPRSLFVPFEFGRPMGTPDDADFQLEVLSQALGLIENQTEPFSISDFEREDLRSEADPKWKPPPLEPADNIVSEVLALKTSYQRQCVDKSRTSVGVSKLPVAEAAALIDSIAAGQPPSSGREEVSPVVMARLAMDDLKAYYIEAALADGSPSSTQIHEWLWTDTMLGHTIKELRSRFMNSKDKKLAAMGESYTVPRRWQDPASS